MNPEIPFHQKVKEYFIENAYYSNEKYPWVLFMIGESLNNDSVLFKTIKAGNLGDMERTLIIPNDELNFDDFKLVLNPDGQDPLTDFMADPSFPVRKHYPSNETGVIVDQTHDKKVYEFFKTGWTYTNKSNPGIRYIYATHSFKLRMLFFVVISTNGYGFSTEKNVRIPFSKINLDDWQVVEGNNNVNHKCYPHVEFRAAINNEQSFKEADYHIDEVVKFCSKLNASLITAQQSSKEPDNTSKGTDDMTHQEKVLSFFKPEGMYIKPSAGGVLYILCEELSNQDQLTFYCNVNNDHGPYRRIRINDIDLNDWQLLGELVVAENSLTGEKIKIVTKKPFRGQSTELISPIQSTEESDKLQSIIEMTRDPITSRIEQLNPETKESLLNILKVRNFFKPNGVYRNKCCANDSHHIYKSYQPQFEKLAFNRVSKYDNGEVLFHIYNADLNDWVFLGIDEPIDPKVQLCQKVKAFFKPGRIYCNADCTNAGCYFEFYEIKESQFDIIRCKRHFINNNPSEENKVLVDNIKFEDWTDIGDVRSLMMPRANCTDPLPEFVENKDADQFFKPGHVYSHRICHSSLCFEGQEVLATGTILRFIEASMGRLVTHRIDKIDLDDWTDITDTSAAPPHKYSFPHYAIYVTDESRRIIPTTNELGPQLLFLCSKRGLVNAPFHGSRGECIDKLSQDYSKNQSYEYNSKFLIPGHIYCKMDNHDVLRFVMKTPSLQSKVILRFRRVPNNEIVEFTTDEFRRDVWEDITYKLYQ